MRRSKKPRGRAGPGCERARLYGALYRSYFTRVLPAVGGWISGDPGAYRYLPDTVLAWPSPEELRGEMEAAGLERVEYFNLAAGIVALYAAEVK